MTLASPILHNHKHHYNNCKVLGATFDGASIIYRLIRLHKSDEIHKVSNIHVPEERDLFFFIDPPHLLKTTRNCWVSTYRQLWVSRSTHVVAIVEVTSSTEQWLHILVDLFERDAGKASGLRMVPKLKMEHIQLTPFSKMCVDLAAQV